MKLFTKKIILSLSIYATLLTDGMPIPSVNSQQLTREEIASKMNAFEKLTPEEQQKEFANIKKMIAAKADQEIKQASSPKWKKILEENKQQNLTRIDAIAKMTQKELHAYHEQTLVETDESRKNQRRPLTAEELTPEKKADIIAKAKAALEKTKTLQDKK